MKKLKISVYFLFLASIIISCDNDSMNDENLEMNIKKTDKTDLAPKSIEDIINSGIDLETYFKSLPYNETKISKNNYFQKDENPDIKFFYNEEDVNCFENLPTEDFVNALHPNYYSFPNYLDENTNNTMFQSGGILPGISFELVLNNEYEEGFYGPGFDYNSYINNQGFYIWSNRSNNNNNNNILNSNFEFTDLVIKFSANNVTNVSMDLFNWNNTNEFIEIYGVSNNLIGTDVVYVNHYDGKFWAVQSIEPISKIVIKSEYWYGYEGIDNVTFGNCDDLDGDGVLNEDDNYPNSDIRENIEFDGIEFDIDNVFSDNGTTMMDQLNELVSEIEEQYNGENWEELHRQFTRGISKITYGWRKDRLISRRERSQLASAAWSSNIPNVEMN